MAILAAIEVDQVAAAAAFIEAEEGPQPGIQPNAYWHQNFKDLGYHFFRLIPDHTGTLHIAPFACVDFTAPSPQLLLTNRQNCPIHSSPLHARPEEVAHTAYDR